MDQVFTIYSVFFVATSLVSFFVAFIAFQRKTAIAAKELAWLMIAAGTGAFCVIFETVAAIPAEKLIWAKLEYLGGVSTPVFYLIFVLRYTGREKFLTKRNILLLFVIPVITLILVFTNEKHNLIWTGFTPISRDTNLMEYSHGMGFWIGYISYSYFLLLLSAVILFTFILTQAKPFKTQAIVVLAGGLFPWISSVLYLTGNNLVPGLDLTPVSITLSGVIAAYAILNFRFLDLVPIARETLVDILPDGIVALDSQNRIQDINRAAISFLGIKNRNVIGIPITSAEASATQLLNAVVDKSLLFQIESGCNGETRTFHIFKKDLKNQPGSRLIIISDITAVKKTEKDLIKAKDHAEESDRLKSAFLANMSHEIRTPMNGILGFTELLKMSDISTEQQQSYLDIIKKGGERMLNIINDIIDISKIESGQMQVYIARTNINEQIDTISSFFMPEAQAKGIHLLYKTTLSDEESVIRTDPDKVYAILTNLVKNAIKFTRSGFVEYGYEKKDGFLEFFVKDTGIGVRPDQREFIFERFRQGSDSLTRNYEGTGLGLSISKAYVHMLGGKIWFESEFGKGSVFNFNIPYDSPRESNPVIETSHDLPDGRKIEPLFILLAEDDKPSELLITRLVGQYCKKLIKVTSGPEAVEACRKNPDLDLILMDIKLPDIDGYEATRQIRQFNKDVIIIAQTAFGLMGEKEKASLAGCNDYISKPINRNVFLGLLRKHFDK
jgi:signal transduction histidine kinase